MRIIAAILLLLGMLSTSAQSPRSVFNGHKFEPDSSGNYSFVVGGHFYGNSAANSGYPAASLLGGLDRILNYKPDLLIVTGDLFLNAKRDSSNYRRSFFDRLPFPIFNAVGNHDLDGGHYQNFEPTFQYFYLGNDLFLLLDTEVDNGSLKGEQLNMFRRALIDATERGVDNLFIFSHRPVWAVGHKEIDELIRNNTRSLTGNNYKKEILPLLQEAQVSADLYWFSGSMGGQAPSSFLYHEEEGIHFIITAVRDTRRDAVLGVNVNSGGIQFTTIPLGQNKVEALEYYNIDLWNSKSGSTEKFNFRLLPYYIKNTVTHRAFWSGVVLMVVIFIGVRSIRRRN